MIEVEESGPGDVDGTDRAIDNLGNCGLAAGVLGGKVEDVVCPSKSCTGEAQRFEAARAIPVPRVNDSGKFEHTREISELASGEPINGDP